MFLPVMAMAGKAGEARAPFDAIIVTAAPPEILPRSWRSWMKAAFLFCPWAMSGSFLKRVRRRGGNLLSIPWRPFASSVSQESWLDFALQTATITPDEAETVQVFTGYSRWVKRIVNAFPVFAMRCTVLTSLVVNQIFSGGY